MILAFIFPIFILPHILGTSEKALVEQVIEEEPSIRAKNQPQQQRQLQQKEEQEQAARQRQISAETDPTNGPIEATEKLFSTNSTTVMNDIQKTNSQSSNDSPSSKKTSTHTFIDDVAVAASKDLDTDTSTPLDSSKSSTSNSTSNININNNTWRCVCEGAGFLPPGLLQTSFGGAVAALRMGTGECYHKQA
jgi:hypothetical protein